MSQNKTCLTCHRSHAYQVGCSHVECPHRNALTAAPTGETYPASDMPDVDYGEFFSGQYRAQRLKKEGSACFRPDARIDE